MPRLDEALQLRGRGLSVIPVHSPGMPLPPGASEADAGKRPLVAWARYQTASPEFAEVREWWRRWPSANLGIVTGPVSGLVVVDIDPAGFDVLKEWEPVLPKTWRARTGRGGAHLFFKFPVGESIPSVNGLLPGIDVKAEGGFVVASPSRHANRQTYEWEISPFDGAPLAPLPTFLLALIRARASSNGRRGGGVRVPETIPEGERNAYLWRRARALRRWLAPDKILADLATANATHCKPPLPEAEVREIAAKAFSQADRSDFGARWQTDAHSEGEGSPSASHGPHDSFLPPKGELGEGTNFRPLSAADMLAEEVEPLRWVWEPFLAEGMLALLVAFMKLGKSTLTYALAVAVAQGKPFLGFPTKQGGVLILAVEEHPRDVKRRLRRFGMRPEDPIYAHMGPLPDSERTRNALRAFIKDNGIALVVLDTLGRYWRVNDENDNAQVTRKLSPLLDLAHESEAAFLLVHHERKSGGEDGRGIRGASALFGLVDQALMLERRQGGSPTQRVLRTLGRYEETPRELVVEWDGDANEYRLVGTPDGDAAKLKVWGALSDEPQDVSALAEKTGLTKKQVRRALEALGESIVCEGRGVKRDPHTYRRGAPNPFPPQPHHIRGGKNPGDGDGVLALWRAREGARAKRAAAEASG